MTWLSIHDPDGPARATAILAHGAGGNRDATILQLMAAELALRAIRSIRIDLPYRRARPKGPPSPSGQAADRAAFAETAAELGLTGPIVWGGHSYGGRMASMAAAEAEPEAGPVALLLSSYPLHPPGKPDKQRTAHLPQITVPTVFVHGARDPFATSAELSAAAEVIAAPVTVVEVPAAHDLAPDRSGAPAQAATALAAALDRLAH